MILPVARPQPADATASWGVTTPRPVSTGPGRPIVNVIVVELITPDRIVAEPDGSESRPASPAVLARYGRTAQ